MLWEGGRPCRPDLAEHKQRGRGRTCMLRTTHTHWCTCDKLKTSGLNLYLTITLCSQRELEKCKIEVYLKRLSTLNYISHDKCWFCEPLWVFCFFSWQVVLRNTHRHSQMTKIEKKWCRKKEIAWVLNKIDLITCPWGYFFIVSSLLSIVKPW